MGRSFHRRRQRTYHGPRWVRLHTAVLSFLDALGHAREARAAGDHQLARALDAQALEAAKRMANALTELNIVGLSEGQIKRWWEKVNRPGNLPFPPDPLS